MRLLQIDPNGSEATALDFHPMVTVVTGLTPSGRDIVLRVARSLTVAQDPGAAGLLEAHGVLLDLDRESLELLDIQTGLDVLVNEADLPVGVPSEAGSSEPPGGGAEEEPGRVPSDEAAAAASRADEVEAFIESTPAGLSEVFDQAKRRRADSRETLGILREAAAKSREKFDKVLTRKKIAEAELAAARESAAPVLRLVEDTDEAGVAAGPRFDPREVMRQRHELEGKIDGAELRIATIERGLEELSAIDTRPLTVLLDAIHNPQAIEYVPSERGHELADEVIDLEKKVADLEGELDKRGLASGAALKQLETARKELASAEKAMRKPELTPEDIAAIEEAHEAVLEAETKASGAFKRAGQKRLDQALLRQQEILDQIGFPTWSSYVMGAGLLAIDHAAEQRLEQARINMEATETHWAHVCEEIESNPAHRQLLDRLEEVYLEAFDLLGGHEPDDLEIALRELQVPKREVTTDELVDALAYQLELVGLELPDGSGTDLTIMAAEAFIEEASAIESRIAELRDERATAEAELAVARGQLGDLPEVDPADLEPETIPGPEPAPEPGPEPGPDPWSGFEAEPVELDAEGAAMPPSQSGFSAFDESDPFGLGGLYADDDEAEPDDGSSGDASADGDGDGDAGQAALSEAAEQSRSEAMGSGFGAGPDASRLEELERAVEVASEEVAEYTEWVESREALVDATLTVETVATSRLIKIANELMEQLRDESEGLFSGSPASTETAGALPRSSAGDNGSSAPAGPPSVHDLERYLDDRLAAQRHISYAGAVPLVLDDALRHVDPADLRQVLDHLQGASETVQVIYLTDDPAIAGWAEEIGFQRAAVVPAPIGFG